MWLWLEAICTVLCFFRAVWSGARWKRSRAHSGEVKAADGDSRFIYESRYLPHYQWPPKDRFYTNERGQIFTLEKLDRETPAEKVIPIRFMAKDAGGKVAFCTVTSSSQTKQWQAPAVYRQPKFRGEHRVNVPKGTSVIKVLASDAPTGAPTPTSPMPLKQILKVLKRIWKSTERPA